MAKKCANGHIRGSDLNCRWCKHSNKMKQRWASNRQTYMSVIDKITSGLKTKESEEKRKKYFSSNTHKEKARQQAIKLHQKRKKGLLKPSKKIKDIKPELAVEHILKSLRVNYQKQCPIGPYVFDFYIPDSNVLIEVQGEYWHSLPDSIRNDIAKATYVKRHTEHTVRYISELETKSLNLKNKIFQLLNPKITKIDFDFKDLIIKEIDQKIAIKFMEAHHYLPRFRKTTRATHGVYINDELIATAIYGLSSYDLSHKYRLKQNQILELSRFVISPNFQKKNLASWFLSRSVKLIKNHMNDVCLIFSFADPHFGHSGTIYRAANWKYCGKTRSSYYYKDSNENILHKKTLWDHASKFKMSEADYAIKNGFTKVETQPKERFIKWLKKPVKTPQKPLAADIVKTQCVCGKITNLKKKSLKRAINKHGKYICHACSLKKKWTQDSYRNKVMNGRKNGSTILSENIVCCYDCNVTNKIGKSAYRSNINNNGYYVCLSCSLKRRYKNNKS